jgi:hypothetical protein
MALQNLEWQLVIFDFSMGNEEIKVHAILLLQNFGGIIDQDILRPLSNHSAYGKAAVDAIKKLSYGV